MKGISTMKLRKILAAAAATAVAVSSIAVSAVAYTLDKDLKTSWSINTTVPGEEFEGATTDSVFTVTYVADASLADKDGENYWCIKPMINDSGWPFINDLEVNTELSAGGDTYTVPVDGTEFKFKVTNAEELEHLQVAGMAFLGHGITLGEITWSDSDSFVPGEAVAAAAAAPAAGDVAAATDSSKGSPDTGIEDVAVAAGLALVAAGGVMIARKRK